MIPKFRIYCYETQEMIVARDYRELAELFAGLDADDSMYSAPMQSTGLLDSSTPKREIFEGDIVRISMRIGKNTTTSIGAVEFDKFEVCFIIRNELGSHYVTMFHVRYLEVIGNIYQNPELLEEVE